MQVERLLRGSATADMRRVTRAHARFVWTVAPGDSACRYLRDVIEIFEQHGWDWSYHAFREWNGWSVEHGPDRNDTRPTPQPTDRQLLLREWFGKNQKPTWAGEK